MPATEDKKESSIKHSMYNITLFTHSKTKLGISRLQIFNTEGPLDEMRLKFCSE